MVPIPNAEKIDWIHSQLDCLEDQQRSLCTAFADFQSGQKAQACVELVVRACAPMQLEIPPPEALVDLAREAGGVWGSNLDALADDEFAHFVQSVLTMALQVLARDVARDWIERIHVEEPNVTTLSALRKSVHTRRPHRLAWVSIFVQHHGVDALCIWLQRLLAGAAADEGVGVGNVRATATRLSAMETLLECLWDLMNDTGGFHPQPLTLSQLCSLLDLMNETGPPSTLICFYPPSRLLCALALIS